MKKFFVWIVLLFCLPILLIARTGRARTIINDVVEKANLLCQSSEDSGEEESDNDDSGNSDNSGDNNGSYDSSEDDDSGDMEGDYDEDVEE